MTKAEQFIENQNHNQARNMQITISSGNYNIKSRYLDKRVEIKFYIHILISILSLDFSLCWWVLFRIYPAFSTLCIRRTNNCIVHLGYQTLQTQPPTASLRAALQTVQLLPAWLACLKDGFNFIPTQIFMQRFSMSKKSVWQVCRLKPGLMVDKNQLKIIHNNFFCLGA